MKSTLYFFLLLGIFSATISTAQDRFYISRLYDKGQFELQVFNNYYSEVNTTPTGENRASFFTVWPQFLYGINTRLNVGMDIRIRSVSQNLQNSDGLFDALKFQNNGRTVINGIPQGYTRTGITSIGPKVKYQPFLSIPNVSFQHSLWFPLGSDLEGNSENGYIDWNNFTWINQAFFDHNLNDNFAIFMEVGFMLENASSAVFSKKEGYYQFSTPINLILSYFAGDKSTIYLYMNSSPRWDTVVNSSLEKTTTPNSFSQFGFGYKYFVTNKIQVEFLTSVFKPGVSNRSANTYNIGVRYFGR